MGIHVALLRAINVGGRNKLPMSSLAELFGEAGASDVRIYIQSGNVVFRARDAGVRRLATRVEEEIAARFGFQAPVLTRTAAELREVVEANPFLRGGARPETLHVGFLADRPGAARIALLDPDRSPPDRFEVRGREIYLMFPNGAGRSKLTNAYLDAKLGTISTIRNWRTVLELVRLAEPTGRAAGGG